MFFRVLGPVEVWEQDRRYSAGSLKEQCVLAILLLEGGRVVSAQNLAARLWDDQPPDRARETLQVYISRLRSRLRTAGDTAGVITSSPAGGYRLDVPAERVDARRFEELLARARAAYAVPDLDRARQLLLQAEALWNGEPLEGLGGQWAEAARQALTERRRGAVFARVDLDLRLGEVDEELISELTVLSGTSHIDERLTGLMMRALHAADRQDEALALFRRVRSRLREELGVEPGAQLQMLHQGILRGDPAPARSGAGDNAPAPHTLDRDQLYLTGRDEPLREILAEITADVRSTLGIAIYALDGMAGIGKTALAVRAAHRLAEQCPDGVLQVNLHTHDPHQPAMDTRAALIQLLDTTAARIGDVRRADSLDALVSLWRRHSSGRRMLLLLDDVLDAEQVRALLPVSAGNIALVTSRQRLLGLHTARHFTVQPLAQQAATDLLAQITGRRFPGQQAALERFSRLCAGLPLAVAVAAAFLRAHPSWALTDLVERLEARPHGSADDPLTGPVHVAFDMSYRALSAQHQTLLRRVAAQPGADIGLQAVAALADATAEESDLALDMLVANHLLEETGRHRYRLHDLLRAFAASRVYQEHDLAAAEAAIDRMLEFYAATAAHAEHTLRPHRRFARLAPTPSARRDPDVTGPATAQGWLDRETANLTASADYALARRGSVNAVTLPYVLAQHLDRRGRWREAVNLLRRAVQVSEDSNSGAAHDLTAQLRTDLAEAYLRTGELDAALACAHTALDAWNTRHDVRGQADALLEIGRIHWHARRTAEASTALNQSAEFYRQAGNLRGQAVVAYHLGIVWFETGRHTDALVLTQDALRSASALGLAALECDLLINLGEMHRQSGHERQALEFFERAQHLADRQGDPHNLAVLASNIAALHNQRGDYHAARASCMTALRLFQALGDRRNEIDALLHLAEALRQAGDYDHAMIQIKRAAELSDTVADPLRHSRIRLAEGHLHHGHGLHHHAVVSYTAALTHAEQALSPLDQALAHRALADALAESGDVPGAQRHREAARHLSLAADKRETRP
jgi:DNA-binding SARP family transcriptional activator/tetratricopeptide (TPR) repeat protein